jgi:hypothetical protein
MHSWWTRPTGILAHVPQKQGPVLAEPYAAHQSGLPDLVIKEAVEVGVNPG